MLNVKVSTDKSMRKIEKPYHEILTMFKKIAGTILRWGKFCG